MSESRVQLTIEVETEGADQLTTLRRELEQVGATGQAAFARLDRSLLAAWENQRRFAASIEPVFNNFFQRLLSGATSFKDAFKKLLSDLLDFFLRTVSRMVATWLGGLRQISGGSSGRSGLLGLVFGGSGGSGGSGGIGGGGSAQLGFGSLLPFLSTGGGGGGSATNIGLLGKLGIDLRGLGPLSGNLLATAGLLGVVGGFQSGSRTLGALGGAATGFAFGGPVGAVIGAVAGFFAGLLGRGKQKRQATHAMQELRRQIEETLSQFRNFQIDFESALAAVNQSFASMQQSVAPLGKPGRRAAKAAGQDVERALKEIRRVQELRQQRQAAIATLPLPEFARGGLVRAVNAGDGKLLAFLHQGEAVLNRRAVQRLGSDFVHRANTTDSLPFGRGALHPRAAAPASVNFHPGAIVVNAAPGMEAEQLAAVTLRELDRRLRDVGLRLGS